MPGIQNISVTASQTPASVAPQNQQSLQPFSNLNLTEAQRAQLRSIFTAAKQNGSSPSDVQQQVNAVLSPAQQQALKGDFAASKGGHHHHHGGADAAAAPTDSAADASTSTSASTPSSTPAATAVAAYISNIENQTTAAQSTLAKTLQSTLLASKDATTSPSATPPPA